MDATIEIRRANLEDAAALAAVLRASYGALYRGWYPDDALARALPALARVRPGLLASGRFRLAHRDGAPVAAGGWSPRSERREGELRQFGTHPDHVNQGAGGALVRACLDEARAAGITRMRCVASLPAETFYAAHGFQTDGFGLAPVGGARFGVALMSRAL